LDSSKRDLVECVKSLYTTGLTTSVSGNQGVRVRDRWMWITPSGVPRYRMRADDLVRIDLKTGKVVAGRKPSMELNMHMNIYSSRPDINAIVHAHSPFTIGISISSEFRLELQNFGSTPPATYR
jgi:L-fuculose-phosphate aldolase